MTQELGKKQYITPKLAQYGAVQNLTQGKVGSNPDGLSGSVGRNPSDESLNPLNK
jgi:hypothetical protein